MNIIFLGLLYSEKSLIEAKKYSKTGLQMAPYNFQKALIEGFKQHENLNLTVVNISPIGSYPINYKKIKIDREEWCGNNIQIGYINLPYIKHIDQEKRLIGEIERLIQEVGDEELYIIAYHTYEPFLNAIISIQKKHPTVKSCLIVTDCVPGREDMDKYMTRRAVKAGNRIVKDVQHIDSFVLLTKHMENALEINGKPHIIMECVCNTTQNISSRNVQNLNRCLYTGTLDTEFGICEMVDCFSELENSELWICGKGNAQEYVENIAKSHHNIKYFGFLDAMAVQELRNNCDFLINPRKPSGTYTKYSFPSKTAEYMVSGKPVIMYKLEGIPDEYDAYLNYLNGTEISDIRNELKAIFASDYEVLCRKAINGRQFILENKNAFKQTTRIIDLLCNI